MSRTKEVVLCAMFTAFIAVLSQVAIPLGIGVPITLQTFAVAITGLVLGWKKGLASVLVYVALGAFGIPIYASFGAGLGVLFGLTGGFLFGFIFLALFCGMSLKFKHKWISVLWCLLGLLVCYILGVAQFALISAMTLWSSVIYFSVTYLPKDIISVIAAFFLSAIIRKTLTAAHFKSPIKH